MDIERARALILALAEGIDPITGEVLPPEHICNNPEIIRAFYTAFNNIDSKSAASEKKQKAYESAGKRWTDEDDKLLRELYEKGVKISEIQKQFMRSRGSIQARLAKLGIVEGYNYWVNR